MTARLRLAPVLAVALVAAAGLGLLALADGSDLAVTQAATPIRIGAADPEWTLPAPRPTASPFGATGAQVPVGAGDTAIWSTPAEFAPPD